MPLPGGTTLKLSNVPWAHLKRAYLSLFLWNSILSFSSWASGHPATSVMME